MTSTATFELNAELRSDKGKGASRRLRRMADRVPAILYGGAEDPSMITLDHKKLKHAMEHEAFYSHILTIDVQGQKQRAVIKDLQRHPYKAAVLHVDFLRVKDSDVITMDIPLHFINEDVCPGAKEGGVINHHTVSVAVRCQAKDLPEYLEVDLGNLALNHAIHLSEIKLPRGVELEALIHGEHSHDTAVVSVHVARVSKADLDEEKAQADAEAAAEAAEAAEGTAAVDNPTDENADKK